MVPFSSFTVRNSVVFLQRPFSSRLCSYSDVYYVWILKGQHLPSTWCSSSLFKDSIWIWKCLQLNLMMHLHMYKGGKFAREKPHSMRIWTSLWFADFMPMLETFFKREIWVNVHPWIFCNNTDTFSLKPEIHPGKWTWNLKITPLKRNINF